MALEFNFKIILGLSKVNVSLFILYDMKAIALGLILTVFGLTVMANQSTGVKIVVQDDKQECLPGVKVEVLGKDHLVFYTNLKGECLLPVEAQNCSLKIQSISYKPMTIPAHAKISKIILQNR